MPPALIELRDDSTVPAYRQIADGIRRHLVSGALEPGTSLPAGRQLAVNLGVHFNTVAKAYRILAEEGWLDLRRRRGAVIRNREAPRAPDQRRIAALTDHLRDIVAELRGLGLTSAQLDKALKRASRP